MQSQPPPTPPTPAVLSASAQTPTKATPTPPAAPAHPVQAAPAANPPVPLQAAPGVIACEKAPRPATTPTVDDPLPDVTANTLVNHTAPTPIDSEAEATLTAEIAKLWSLQKDGKATVRRTRAELKAMRLALGEKLHTVKVILVRTGRGGGWASYLRSLRLSLPSADRYVAEHEAALGPPKEKLLTEELTVEEIRHLAKKILPKVQRALTSQELVYEFIHELVWNIDVAEAWYTDKGFEIPKIGSDHALEPDAPIAESAGPAPIAG